jgi:uncharacterized protein
MTQTALITGASGGIGYEFAHIFAREHYNLILVARSEQILEELKAQLEQKYAVQCTVIVADLSNLEEVRSLVAHIHDARTNVDVLINNAGFGDYGFFTETSWEKELQMINLNVTALTFLTKEFAKSMVARKGGNILNVASTAAFQPGPLMAVYYATKAFVLSFSEAIANELQGTGVKVTALCPGPTISGFEAAAELGESKLFRGKKLPSSREVAEYGYKAMKKGKRVAVHGFVNSLQVFLLRFSPRILITAIVRHLSEKA